MRLVPAPASTSATWVAPKRPRSSTDRLHDPRGHAGGVRALHRLAETDVAGAAALAVVRLAEVRDERTMPAHGLLAEGVHLAELAERAGRRLGAVGRHHGLPQAVVAAAHQQQTLGLQAVAAGAAGLLLVVLERLRHAGVDDVADVGAVDAHAEGHGGHHDVGALVHERVLVGAALVVGEARRGSGARGSRVARAPPSAPRPRCGGCSTRCRPDRGAAGWRRRPGRADRSAAARGR